MYFVVITVLTLLLVAPRESAPVAELMAIDPLNADGATLHESNLNKRQFDMNVDASFEETLGAELSAELSGNIWKNEEGTARLDGSATYSQHFNTIGGGGLSSNGNARTGISFRYHHD